MIEVTNPSRAFYGVGGARISAQDGATLRLEPTGMLTVMCSVTEQGQGTEAVFAQVAASAVGVTLDKVRVITGDTAVTPYGGGTWPVPPAARLRRRCRRRARPRCRRRRALVLSRPTAAS